MTVPIQVPGRGENEQARLWNGPVGRAWVQAQELLDQLFKPFEDLLVESASVRSVGELLDVGCGTGATTLAVARRLGASAVCTGIDVSEPMIAFARARAEREGTSGRFVCADAQTHSFPSASFDAVISRFGVMFFDRPVEAFANLRRATRDGGRLRFIAWRGAEHNPFMTTAERAAAPLLPSLQARKPDAPGQFAFADRQRIFRILDESGWREVDIQPLDVACTLPEKELVRYLAQLGPVGALLQEADAGTRTRVIEVVRAAFEPYVRDDEVRFTSACWMVTARAPSVPALGDGAIP